MPSELAHTWRITKRFDGNGGAEGNSERYTKKRKERRSCQGQDMAEEYGEASQSSRAGRKHMRLVIGPHQQTSDVTIEPWKNDHGNREKYRRSQMNGQHGNDCGGQGQQQTVEGGGRRFEKPATGGNS